MNLFDKLYDEGLVYEDGHIKGCMGYDEQVIEVINTIRNAILVEDSEEFLIYDQVDKNEFLFRLFQILFLGGKLNQYGTISMLIKMLLSLCTRIWSMSKR